MSSSSVCLDPAAAGCQASDVLLVDTSYRNSGRAMLGRRAQDRLLISTLEPGVHKGSCLTCCASPACCPACSCCPCCDDADYVKEKREASKYVYVRENSIEWNEPEIVMLSGASTCCGVDPCLYQIHDNIRVVYFDDPIFDSLTDRTRTCNECRTCLCGGRGERVSLASTCCLGLCIRSSFPCPCIPSCCPTRIFPCAWKRELYVKDAAKALYEINSAMRKARSNVLYKDESVKELSRVSE